MRSFASSIAILLCSSACSGPAANEIASSERASEPKEDTTNGARPPAPTPPDASPLPADDAGICAGNPQKVPFEKACQECLDVACCAELTGCFALKTSPDCNDYAQCVKTCNGASGINCFVDCASTHPKAVVSAYEAIGACAKKSCKACTF